MNFKNISLFMLSTCFVGAGVYAQDEFKETMSLEQKLAYKQQELEGLEALKEVYIEIHGRAQWDCIHKRGVEEWGDSELCMYSTKMLKKKRDIMNEIYKLRDEIGKLEGTENDVEVLRGIETLSE